MAANGAVRTRRLAGGTADWTSMQKSFPAVGAEVVAVGIVKTTFGAIHISLPTARTPSITFKATIHERSLRDRHKSSQYLAFIY
jgi:hypothetical protein